MKIILFQEVKNLGNEGDIKEVSDGYARNFLIPKGFARLADKRSIIELKMRKRTKEIRKKKDKKEQGRMAQNLQGMVLNIPMKTGEKNKLYASVTSQIISQALREKGFEIPDKQIIIPKSIKRLGEHSANIKLGGGKTAMIKLNVIALGKINA